MANTHVHTEIQVDHVFPRHSMYAIYAYIGVALGVNVGIYGSPMECLGFD